MAPHTPRAEAARSRRLGERVIDRASQRSEHPGEAVALLDTRVCDNRRLRMLGGAQRRKKTDESTRDDD